MEKNARIQLRRLGGKKGYFRNLKRIQTALGKRPFLLPGEALFFTAQGHSRWVLGTASYLSKRNRVALRYLAEFIKAKTTVDHTMVGSLAEIIVVLWQYDDFDPSKIWSDVVKGKGNPSIRNTKGWKFGKFQPQKGRRK